mmetsp:Transcript_32933/g.76941  ORF Transcript_32933/g.76941 Transcript_32933/m.76941 type:complete len:311 (+) Transcript_32933:488-1420(+)
MAREAGDAAHWGSVCVGINVRMHRRHHHARPLWRRGRVVEVHGAGLRATRHCVRPIDVPVPSGEPPLADGPGEEGGGGGGDCALRQGQRQGDVGGGEGGASGSRSARGCLDRSPHWPLQQQADKEHGVHHGGLHCVRVRLLWAHLHLPHIARGGVPYGGPRGIRDDDDWGGRGDCDRACVYGHHGCTRHWSKGRNGLWVCGVLRSGVPGDSVAERVPVCLSQQRSPGLDRGALHGHLHICRRAPSLLAPRYRHIVLQLVWAHSRHGRPRGDDVGRGEQHHRRVWALCGGGRAGDPGHHSVQERDSRQAAG